MQVVWSGVERNGPMATGLACSPHRGRGLVVRGGRTGHYRVKSDYGLAGLMLESHFRH